MKSLKEIQKMLVSELCNRLTTANSDMTLDNYNAILGDTSFLLAGLLGQQLRHNFPDWDPQRWIDDSILTKFKLDQNKVLIWGVMIWGKEQVTNQWTEPFYFELGLGKNCADFIHYTFLFSDLDTPEITYEQFNVNRDVWQKEYFRDNEWNPFNRNWQYIIKIKNTK